MNTTLLYGLKKKTLLMCKPVKLSVDFRYMQTEKKRNIKPLIQEDHEIQLDPLPYKEEQPEIPDRAAGTSILNNLRNFWFGEAKAKTDEAKIDDPNWEEMATNYLGKAKTDAINQQTDKKLKEHNYVSEEQPDGNLLSEINNNSKDPIINLSVISQSPEVISLDQFMKLTVNQLDVLSEKVGINLEKSQELTSKWDKLKLKLDAYIKSLKDTNYKKIFTIASCISAALYFSYQMGLYRKIPDFVTTLVSNIPTPNFTSTTPKAADVLDVESAITKIKDYPLTPLTIVTSIGTIATTLMILRASLWLIRKFK